MLKSANLYVRCLSSILPTRHATMPPCHHAMHWRALALCRAFTRGWLAHPLPRHVQRISCLYPMARAAYTKIFGDENTVCIELPLKHQEVYRFTYFPEFPGPLVSRDRSARLRVSANKTRTTGCVTDHRGQTVAYPGRRGPHTTKSRCATSSCPRLYRLRGTAP